ncbi:hypothetical protein TrST_g13555 [Triparma strigata]|uniref:Uncharacterized protein n=1 Tax=Triparma strigata TaxID=1606541 RepID=A0A9W6ZE83_9STRA|nr:hypothetical protein TrST_g13555 [Triparma strigata]
MLARAAAADIRSAAEVLVRRRWINTHTPPLAVRTALVGTSTALLTPLFPVIGFNQLAFRWLDPATRSAITGGSSMLYFSAMVLAPNSFYYAPILLPFALGNGVTAAAVYASLDVMVCGPQALAAKKLGPIPLAGPVIGGATAVIAPFTFPVSMAVVWPDGPIGTAVLLDPETYRVIDSICMNKIVLPCLGMTGFAAGLLIHVGLKPVIVGIPGFAWQKLAGAILGASVLGLGALYSTGMRTDVPHLSEVEVNEVDSSYKERDRCYIKGKEELCWVPGVDPEKGAVVSVCRNGDGAGDGAAVSRGKDKYLVAELLRNKVGEAEFNVLFTSRASAYFGGLLGFVTGSRKFMMKAEELRALLDGLPVGENLITDAAVAFAFERVDRAKVEEGLRECWELLEGSRLAERRRKGLIGWVGGQTEGWADGHIGALFEELWLRGAELRELERLKEGAKVGVVGSKELEEGLERGGIEIDRALAALKKLRGNSIIIGTAREVDWELIGRKRKQEGAESFRSGVRIVSALGVIGGVLLGGLGFMYK